MEIHQRNVSDLVVDGLSAISVDLDDDEYSVSMYADHVPGEDRDEIILRCVSLTHAGNDEYDCIGDSYPLCEDVLVFFLRVKNEHSGDKTVDACLSVTDPDQIKDESVVATILALALSVIEEHALKRKERLG